MNTPLVSVIIPTYNREKKIERSVRSVLDQTYKNIEVIVVDDGSTDNTEKIVKHIDDPRLRYIKQRNGGPCSARNTGIKEAKGDWIAFQDSDDFWRNKKLEKQMNIGMHTIYDMVCCGLLMHNGKDRIFFPKRVSEGKIFPKEDLYGIGTQTILIRTDVAKKNLFDEKIPRYEDTEWIYRIVQKYDAFFIKEPLVDYAINKDSLSSDDKKMYYGLKKIYEKYPKIKKESPLMAMHACRDLMGVCLKNIKKRNFGRGKIFFKLGIKFYPGALRYFLETL